MGREDDRKRREELRRRDDVRRREKVKEARTNLYDKGYALAGKWVDGHLKDESMVPTLVRICLFVVCALDAHQPPPRTPFRLSSPNMVLIITIW